MLKVNLLHNRGFAWHHQDGWHVKGFALGPGERYLEGAPLVGYLQGLAEPEKWLAESNGHFTIVKEGSTGGWAAVDKLRAFPLFYAETEGQLRLTDDAVWLAGELERFEISDTAAEELRTINCTLGNGTLVSGVYQLQAGSWLKYDGKLNQQVYYQHLHPYALKDNTQQQTLVTLSATASKVFGRLVDSLGGRTAVIPLSGGSDSRFIVAMLKTLGYASVICYTYGRADSPEVEVSRAVAKQLGYPWHFVEYTEEVLETFMGAEGAAYRAYGAQLNTIAHEQDWFAVGRLLAEGKIPADGVVVPGYCGDFPAGSYLPKEHVWPHIALSNKGLGEYIYQNHLERYGNPEMKNAVLTVLDNELAEYVVNSRESFVSVYEHWLTINRLSKFIVNAIRVYEYYGLQWRMPLWDDAWANLWYNIPNQYRKDRNLYKAFLEIQLFEPLGVKVTMQQVDGMFANDNLVTKLKAATPKPIRQMLKKWLIPQNQQDANRLQWLSKRIYQEIEDKQVVKEPTAMNHVHACWYLETIKKELP